MRIVFLGSGAFGLPTLKQLSARHDVALVVTQPDRPAGRGRDVTPTPIAAWADDAGLPCFKVQDVNAQDSIDRIRGTGADAWVIIAFGQKLGESLLSDTFAMNLHASLLPRHRGAAPIHHAILSGDLQTGLSVITIADRIDAGHVLAQTATAIEPGETTGELHDRLALMGPPLIEQVLADHRDGTLDFVPQDEDQVTHASKLTKQRATVHFQQPAASVRNGIHGLVPWPGCAITIGGRRLGLLRVEVVDDESSSILPGTIDAEGIVACDPGHIRLLDVQSPGKRPMTFKEWLHGHPLEDDSICTPWTSTP